MKPISERRTIAEILELSEHPSPDKVRDNYRRLVKLYHPDVNPTAEAAAYMVKLNQAYAIATGRQQVPQPRPRQPRPRPIVRIWFGFRFDTSDGLFHWNDNTEPPYSTSTSTW